MPPVVDGETNRNKHCPGRVGIRDDSHRQGNHNAAGCRETLVLSKPFRQPGVANQSEGDSNDRRPKDTAGDPL